MDRQTFSVNRRTVAAALATGMGHAGLNSFSEIMNIPTLHPKTFSHQIKIVSKQSEHFKDIMLAKAVEKVKEAYPEQAGDLKKIHTSYDGSWQKRGHVSKSGLGCVIERRTGLCVDYHTMTTYCPQCSVTGERLRRDEGEETYQRWFNVHQQVCVKNFVGPSGNMEKEGAVIMWKQWEEQNGMQYVSMISDGDAKTIGEIHKADPYKDVVV